MIFADAASTVGRTPLIALRRLSGGLRARLVAKAEMRNPAGSIKDRLAVALIEDAENRGVLRPGTTLIEATGGNTGIGLAFAAAIRGYRLILTMPEAMSEERVALLRHYGAEVILTPGILMADAVDRAREIAATRSNAINLDQFSNPANPDLHRRTTGPEIWQDTDGRVDVFVSAVGTGGTLSGVGQFLKAKNPTVKIVAVEPAGAALLSGGQPGQHQMPGIGVGFIPAVLDRSVIDEVIVVHDDEAFACARRLAREEGILAGVSSGAALHAALQIGSREEFTGKTIVVLLADTGERYLSTRFECRHEGVGCGRDPYCLACDSIALLHFPEWPASWQSIVFQRLVYRLLCHEPANGKAAGRSRRQMLSKPCPPFSRHWLLSVACPVSQSGSTRFSRSLHPPGLR